MTVHFVGAGPGAADLLTKIAEGMAVEGMESLAPALVDGMELMIDAMPDDTLVLVADRLTHRRHGRAPVRWR